MLSKTKFNIPQAKCLLHFKLAFSLISSIFFVLSGITKCTAQQPVCNGSLWNHVYHSYRFVVHTQCTYAIGTVKDIYAEPDGDYHIKLKLEPDFTYMLNSVNISDESGDLVCEIICANQITQSDAVAPCQNYTSSIFVPNVGEHVKITGPYVTDNDHGWNEIHPVSKIEITTQTDTTGNQTGLPNIEGDHISVSVYPNPVSSVVNFQLSDHPSSPVFITITDGIGRLAGQFQMMGNPKFEVNTTYFPQGMYYYNAMQNDKLLKSGKFIVTH